MCQIEFAKALKTMKVPLREGSMLSRKVVGLNVWH